MLMIEGNIGGVGGYDAGAEAAAAAEEAAAEQARKEEEARQAAEAARQAANAVQQFQLGDNTESLFAEYLEGQSETFRDIFEGVVSDLVTDFEQYDTDGQFGLSEEEFSSYWEESSFNPTVEFDADSAQVSDEVPAANDGEVPAANDGEGAEAADSSATKPININLDDIDPTLSPKAREEQIAQELAAQAGISAYVNDDPAQGFTPEFEALMTQIYEQNSGNWGAFDYYNRYGGGSVNAESTPQAILSAMANMVYDQLATDDMITATYTNPVAAEPVAAESVAAEPEVTDPEAANVEPEGDTYPTEADGTLTEEALKEIVGKVNEAMASGNLDAIADIVAQIPFDQLGVAGYNELFGALSDPNSSDYGSQAVNAVLDAFFASESIPDEVKTGLLSDKISIDSEASKALKETIRDYMRSTYGYERGADGNYHPSENYTPNAEHFINFIQYAPPELYGFDSESLLLIGNHTVNGAPTSTYSYFKKYNMFGDDTERVLSAMTLQATGMDSQTYDVFNNYMSSTEAGRTMDISSLSGSQIATLFDKLSTNTDVSHIDFKVSEAGAEADTRAVIEKLAQAVAEGSIDVAAYQQAVNQLQGFDGDRQSSDDINWYENTSNQVLRDVLTTNHQSKVANGTVVPTGETKVVDGVTYVQFKEGDNVYWLSFITVNGSQYVNPSTYHTVFEEPEPEEEPTV